MDVDNLESLPPRTQIDVEEMAKELLYDQEAETYEEAVEKALTKLADTPVDPQNELSDLEQFLLS